MRALLFFCLMGIGFAKADESIKNLAVKPAKEAHFQIRLISPYLQVKKGTPFLVGIHLQMDEDWYSYWSFPGDFGLAPQISVPNMDFVQIKALAFPRPERKELVLGKKKFYSFIYKKELLIPFEVLIQESYPKNFLDLKMQMEWGLCKEICISKKNSLNLLLPISNSFKEQSRQQKVFNFWKHLLPEKAHKLNLKTEFAGNKNSERLSFSFKPEINCLDLLPRSRLDFLTEKPSLIHQKAHSCSFKIKRPPSALDKLSGLLIYSEKEQIKSTFFSAQKKKRLGLFWFILLAFLGGLILNIMPCVLPIIFLKFYNTLELKNLSKRKILFLNIYYAIGVIASFLVLALFIFISKNLGHSLGWGFHLQSPLFVSLLALLFTVMGFYLLDWLSFSVPKLPKLFKDEKGLSHFLSGILSTTAASPCTVPFMASAVGFAFSRSYLEIFIIFFFLGFGLSFPYLVIGLFPKSLKYFPSPGSWTNKIKKLLSIPLFLTSLWLIFILYFQLNLKIFLISLFIFPLMAVFTFIQNFFSKKHFKFPASVFCLALIVLVFVFQFISNKPELKTIEQTSSFLDSNWQTFDENKVFYDQSSGKNVFVAFGAKWCLTCKFNERFFEDIKFKQIVEKHDIQLYYGDWTNKNDSITSFLESYSKQGVPFYIFYKGNEKALVFPALLTKENFLEQLKDSLK